MAHYRRMAEPSRRPLRLLRDDLASHVRPFPRDLSHLARLIASSPVALVEEDPWQQL